MRNGKLTKAITGKLFVVILAAFAATAAFADRTANRDWVERNFVNKTNQTQQIERRYALFILDFNAENGGKWRSFEMKASTNNFAHVGGGSEASYCFWGVSDEADESSGTRGRGQDRMLLFWLTTRLGGDGEKWTKIPTTLDLTGANPRQIAVLVSPDLCFDGRWLGEGNEDAVWCFSRGDSTGSEKDSNGEVLWHPVRPVMWYRGLPAWAR